jgi:hypothetical protein
LIVKLNLYKFKLEGYNVKIINVIPMVTPKKKIYKIYTTGNKGVKIIH